MRSSRWFYRCSFGRQFRQIGEDEMIFEQHYVRDPLHWKEDAIYCSIEEKHHRIEEEGVCRERQVLS